ncbi:hypothetical protein FPV67DRAFT_1560201 [Lyophyllum atratum]|nr:hypothetical protein FPV67DRAFT_1560201 [Lyophyllum atratum]
MPAELPGLYWDEERNRYFPLSSKPKTPQPPKPQAKDDRLAGSLKRKRQTSLWNSTELLRTTCYPLRSDILCSHYANTSRLSESKVPVFGRIKAFCSTTLDGQIHRFIGDSRGWLYTSTPLDTVAAGRDLWCTDLNLQPEAEVRKAVLFVIYANFADIIQISSICVSGARCIATCSGPSAKISVQDLNVTGRTSLLSLNAVHDIWSSHLQDSALVLGVEKRAVYLPDIDTSMSIQHLQTHSDVFSVWQHGYNIYTGCRNGTIMRFDKRLGKHGDKLYTDRLRNQQRTSVVHLETLGDSQLLTSHMNGDLMTFDLRFTRQQTPLVSYEGHTNTYTRKLGIALDPKQEFLFAAGEDQRIRGWSVSTGLPLLPLSLASAASEQRHTFSAAFPGVIETMQVTAEQDGLCLWAGYDQTLYQSYLGQQQ